MLNYERLIPVHLEEMGKLKKTDPKYTKGFSKATVMRIVVNKNSNVSFCAVDADNALEHVYHTKYKCTNEVS